MATFGFVVAGIFVVALIMRALLHAMLRAPVIDELMPPSRVRPVLPNEFVRGDARGVRDQAWTSCSPSAAREIFSE